MPTFLEIKTSVQGWLERDETKVIDKIVQFGQKNLEDNLRIPPMEYNVVSLTAPVFTIAETATGGSLTSASTYYYVMTAVNSFGESLVSAEVSNSPTAGTTNLHTLSWSAVDGADSYNIYVNTASGGNLLLGNSLTTSFIHSSGVGSGAIPSVDTTLTLASGVNSIPVPKDYLELIYFSLIDPTTSNRSVIMNRVWNKELMHGISDTASTNTGTPQNVTLSGNNFVFEHYTDQAYTVEMVYYRRLSLLQNDVDSNFWTSNEGERALIYGSLVEFGPFLGDAIGEDPRSRTWGIKLKEEKNNLKSRYKRDNISGQRTQFGSNPNLFFNSNNQHLGGNI